MVQADTPGGWRILIRVIARHALAHPNLYEDGSSPERQATPDGNRKDGG